MSPCPHARVEVDYGALGISYTPLVLIAPHPPDAVYTDTDGFASLPVHNVGPSWLVSADGYLKFNGSARKGRVPDDFVKTEVDGREIHVVPLYRTPGPLVWIVVADGYRGPVRVSRVPVTDSLAAAPGQREFVFHASPEGHVKLEVPSLLKPSSRAPSIRFRYAGGTEIPPEHLRLRATLVDRFPPQTQPSFGWDHIYGDRQRDLYVVGDVQTTVELIEPFRHKRGGYLFGPEGFDRIWPKH